MLVNFTPYSDSVMMLELKTPRKYEHHTDVSRNSTERIQGSADILWQFQEKKLSVFFTSR